MEILLWLAAADSSDDTLRRPQPIVDARGPRCRPAEMHGVNCLEDVTCPVRPGAYQLSRMSLETALTWGNRQAPSSPG